MFNKNILYNYKYDLYYLVSIMNIFNLKIFLYVFIIMKLYIINAPFDNWKLHLYNNFFVKYIDNYDDLDKSSNYKIIPICQNDYIRYTTEELLFTNDTTKVNILNNKGLFAKFMMQNFNKYIPKTIYFNVNDKEIYDSKITLQKMIQKPTIGCALQIQK